MSEALPFVYELLPRPVLHSYVGKPKKKRYEVATEGGYRFNTGILGELYWWPTLDPVVVLRPDGELWIAEGFLYDGPSGIAIDTADFMRASCIHDALYLLIQAGQLAWKHRAAADRIMREVAKEDGMGCIRRSYAWAGVRVFGGLWMALDGACVA